MENSLIVVLQSKLDKCKALGVGHPSALMEFLHIQEVQFSHKIFAITKLTQQIITSSKTTLNINCLMSGAENTLLSVIEP